MDPRQAGSNPVLRDYRKGNWTIEETMVLIEAKRMDDQRRMKRLGDGSERGKPAELRWKWVEDYCWKNGCLRSQNQCNDKWDNLLICCFKSTKLCWMWWRVEVRRLPALGVPAPPMCRRCRHFIRCNCTTRLCCCPRRCLRRRSRSSHLVVCRPTRSPQQTPRPVVVRLLSRFPRQVLSPIHLFRHDSSKRRKRSGGGGGEVGSAISRSASIIAEAMQSSEEREERRHRELLSLHQRRLQIEETKAEINRQGINGVVDAINRLANSILAFADNRNQSSPP